MCEQRTVQREEGREKREERDAAGERWPLPANLTPFALRASLFLLALLCALSVARVSVAQAKPAPAQPTAFQLPGAVNPEERAELRRQLLGHAAVLEAQSAVVKITAKLVGPSVVHIEADIPQASGAQYGRGQTSEEDGSGVIVELDGKHFVLTNLHVVRNAPPKSIRINLADGRRIYPTKVLSDPDSDVAVLAVDAPTLVATPLGDSDKVEIGDFVLAVGSPFGLSRSVTFGIISAKGRRNLRLGDASVRFQDFLQTDAAINPGNSGGPLVNLHGEIIGINTAIASNSGGNEGIGFAIPANMFKRIAKQLIETGARAAGVSGSEPELEVRSGDGRRTGAAAARRRRSPESRPTRPPRPPNCKSTT